MVLFLLVIDDGEIENFKKLCNEIFGEKNFIAQSIRRTINSGKHDITTIAPFHEYVLMYAKKHFFNSISKKAKRRS